MTRQRKFGLVTLRGYLIVAFALVIVKIVEVAVHRGGARAQPRGCERGADSPTGEGVGRGPPGQALGNTAASGV